MELANAVEPVQDGRIHIEKINGQFIYELKGRLRNMSQGLISHSPMTSLHEVTVKLAPIQRATRYRQVGAFEEIVHHLPQNVGAAVTFLGDEACYLVVGATLGLLEGLIRFEANQ